MNPAALADFAARAPKVRELCARPWTAPEDALAPVEIGQVMRGMDTGGLPPNLQRKLESILIAANKVLERYPLRTFGDYHLLSLQDREELRRIYKRIPDLVPSLYRQR